MMGQPTYLASLNWLKEILPDRAGEQIVHQVHKRKEFINGSNKQYVSDQSNPYDAGKTLLGPKCYVYLKVEQVDLDQHKSLSLNNINCNVPLADLSKLFLF